MGFKVAAGETCRFSRKTMGALSQKEAGGFDKYLADFQTQAAYIQPGTKECLEVFMAGLRQACVVVFFFSLSLAAQTASLTCCHLEAH